MRPFTLAILLYATSISGCCQPQGLAARAHAYLKRYADNGRFMGSVLIARDGRVLFEEGYGWANVEWKIPNDSHTRFRLASVTKQFTAVAILQLAEKRKLAVTNPVSKYYTGAPVSWRNLTIHHLLTHTSGIPSYTELPDFYEKKSWAPMTPAEIIQLTKDMPLQFEPGLDYRYNNTG